MRFYSNAMGTFETAVTTYYEDEEEEERQYYEFEPLPTLLEDEENISLADILCLRDACLSEQEVWAVCLECALSLQSIAHSPLFHTLCITPDTLAFNAHGNVCFMELLSDDPEGSFLPPEFDRTGNTFEGHIFSLGSTLAAALEFVIEPELEPELGSEVKRLLDLMQQERPEDRPSILDILALGKVKLTDVSSLSICRKLSAIGRRVLSIESMGTFQDGLEISWGVHEQQLFYEPNSADGSSSSEDLVTDQNMLRSHTTHFFGGNRRLMRHMAEPTVDSTPLGRAVSERGNAPHREEDIFGMQPDSRSQNSSPVLRQRQERRGRSRGVLNRSSSVPDSNNPPSVLPRHVNRNESVTDLTEIGTDKLSMDTIFRSVGHQESGYNLSSRLSDPDMHLCSTEALQSPKRSLDSNPDFLPRIPGCSQGTDSTVQGRALKHTAISNCTFDQTSVHSNQLSPSNHMTKSMLCLNEDTQDEWISLKELLCLCGHPLSVKELWALCYTCLSTLQTYIDYPAYLCLDSVYVGLDGEMMFLKTKNTGSCDAFYLAPEFQEHGIVTEKVCVYGVAAVLWATAKFNLSPNQKLAMPRKLKRLLLEMAKRTPVERPSITAAKKSCRDYLLRQGMTAEEVWTKLVIRSHQLHHRDVKAGLPMDLDKGTGSCLKESSSLKTGFLPTTSRNKLSPVQGPVPHHVTILPNLPDAFTSSATHFTPIILTQEDTTNGVPIQRPASAGSLTDCKSPSGSQHDKAINLMNALVKEHPPRQQMAKEPEKDQVSEFVSQESAASSSSSSDKTLVNTPSPTSSGHAGQEDRSFPAHFGSSSHTSTVFNSFLLQQDPQTGRLTLVPVQVAAPESVSGLEFNISTHPASLSLCSGDSMALPTKNEVVLSSRVPPVERSATAVIPQVCPEGGPDTSAINQVPPVESPDTAAIAQVPPVESPDTAAITQVPPVESPDTAAIAQFSPVESTAVIPQVHPQYYSSPSHKALHRKMNGKGVLEAEGGTQWPGVSSHPQIHPSLYKVITLIRQEFAFDGYLENGVEDLQMGEYIISLRNLQYGTFSRAVSEKFFDLYWDEKLLEILHHVVNENLASLSSWSSSSKPNSDVQASLKLMERAAMPIKDGEPKGTADQSKVSYLVPNAHMCENTQVLPQRLSATAEPRNTYPCPEMSEEPLQHGRRSGGLRSPERSEEPLQHGHRSGGKHSTERSVEPLQHGRPGGKHSPERSEEPLQHGRRSGGKHSPERSEEPLQHGRPGGICSPERSEEPLQHGRPGGICSPERSEEPLQHGRPGGICSPEWSEEPLQHGRPGGICSPERSEEPLQHGRRSGGKHSTERSEEPLQHGRPGGICSPERSEEPLQHGCRSGGIRSPERSEEPLQHGHHPALDAPFLPTPVEVKEGGVVSRGEMDLHPVASTDDSLSAESSWLVGGPAGCFWRGHHDQQSLDYSEDMLDTDSFISNRLLEDGRPLSPASGIDSRSCNLGWALAFYGEDYFREDVQKYVGRLGQHREAPCVDSKMQELHQQIMIETRNLKKTKTFYQRLLHHERRNKGSDAKLMLSKLQIQLEEMRSKVEFLGSVKKSLEVLQMDHWGLELSLLPSLATSGPAPLELCPCEDPSVLSIQSGNVRGKNSQTGISPLQAGTPLGLMAYLYSRNATREGYIPQFLYTYRYFCTPHEFLQFLMDKFYSAAGRESSADRTKVYQRSLDLLHAWIEDCRPVDFPPKSSLLKALEEFISSAVVPVDSRGEGLLMMLQYTTRNRQSHAVSDNHGSPTSLQEDDDMQLVHSLCRKSSIEDSSKKSFHWRISRVVEPQVALPKEKVYSIAAALPRPCYSSLMDELPSSSLKIEERQPFFQNEQSAQHCAQQLTLLQQEIFRSCHPVHLLNSRAQGVRDKAVNVTKPLSPDALPAEGSSLFAQEAILQERPLLWLLKHDENVTNWVSAEIVICDSVKAQTSLLSKFLMMAKYCYQSRNFATAIQILGGIENVIVRQLPAWKHLSGKVCEVLEELKAVQVFLKSDNLCLMEGARFKRLPTLPALHILTMHVQQLEIGGFTLARGAYKWPKLRNIAKVVSQIRAFQENSFMYCPDLELQAYLRQRITHLTDCDIPLLAAENDTNFHQVPADRQSKKIQDTLRRMKATFQ